MGVGSTIVRQWHLLTLLPKGPRRIDTATLEDRLRERGLDVHRRTIQRDLVELAGVFPIVSDDRSRPYGWRWADDAELLCAIPALPGARDGVPTIELVLHVRASAVKAVSEGLRGPEGQAREVRVDAASADPDGVLVTARVPDGCALRRWLFGFADALVVVAPAHLRAELADKAARIASVYNEER
ncbi:MAG: transcriptional factor-related protein [Myxococcaceae bacterium]|nr:transcriptional factor-related protein [Myxococcaceae bacterium]